MRRELIQEIDLRPTHDRSSGRTLATWQDYFMTHPDLDEPKLVHELRSHCGYQVAWLEVVHCKGLYYVFLNGELVSCVVTKAILNNYWEYRRVARPCIHWTTSGFVRPIVSFVVQDDQMQRVFWDRELLSPLFSEVNQIWIYDDEPIICGIQPYTRAWFVWWRGRFSEPLKNQKTYTTELLGVGSSGPVLKVGVWRRSRLEYNFFFYAGQLHGYNASPVVFHGMVQMEPVVTFSTSSLDGWTTKLFIGVCCEEFPGRIHKLCLEEHGIVLSYYADKGARLIEEFIHPL